MSHYYNQISWKLNYKCHSYDDHNQIWQLQSGRAQIYSQ
jgi:hypothetical protein